MKRREGLPVCVFVNVPRPHDLNMGAAAAIGPPATGKALRELHESLVAIEWVVPILAMDESYAAPKFWRSSAVWNQGSGDLGLRLELVLRRAHVLGPGALAVRADTPAIPGTWLKTARDDLKAGRAVLGVADDGGFYLLGLPRVPFGLFADIRWSAPDTAEQIRARLLTTGFEVRLLPGWFRPGQPSG